MVNETFFLEENFSLVKAYYSSMSTFWHPVCPSSFLLDKPLGIQLLGRRLVLARLNGKVSCFDDLCRHLGAALSGGKIEKKSFLRCPYHGWLYNEEGRCIEIPSRRSLPIPLDARIRSYLTQESMGMIWVSLVSNPKYPIPRFEEFENNDFHQLDEGKWKESHWRASPQRIVLGQLDDTHFAWVHPSTIGHPDIVEAPSHRVTKENGFILSTFTICQRTTAPSSGFSRAETAKKEDTNTVHYTIAAGINWIHLRKTNDKGEAWVLLQLISPLSYHESRVFWRIARNFDKLSERDPIYEKIQIQIMEEDRRVIESQRPWLLPPMSSSLSMYLRPSDLPLIEYHKWMEEEKIPPL
ncbi:aromatic ring-hydroxylating dioxygenase subunit alpha [Methylacidiphilum caldifontis]|nr:aromatic ring-hydroxylating dioxygenase subunit alpha [Methylacidiphilum caldifontis]